MEGTFPQGIRLGLGLIGDNSGKNALGPESLQQLRDAGVDDAGFAAFLGVDAVIGGENLLPQFLGGTGGAGPADEDAHTIADHAVIGGDGVLRKAVFRQGAVAAFSDGGDAVQQGAVHIK